MHKKFEVNWTKIKGGSQPERKAAEVIKIKMPLVRFFILTLYILGMSMRKIGLKTKVIFKPDSGLKEINQ